MVISSNTSWYHITNRSQKHDQPMSIQTFKREQQQEVTAKQGHSLNFECKLRFIIRLFFWVTQPMPWLHWIKIKHSCRSPASLDVSCCPCSAVRRSTQLKGGTQRGRVAPCQGSQPQPWVSVSRDWATHTPSWFPLPLPTLQSPPRGKQRVTERSEAGRAWPQAKLDHSALSNGEKNTSLTSTVWGWAKRTWGKTQNRPNNATRAKDDIKDYIYLEDIRKLVIGRQH